MSQPQTNYEPELKKKIVRLHIEGGRSLKSLAAEYHVSKASIAVVLPWHLSGKLLNPLRDWDCPNQLPFIPKRRCLLV